MFIIKDDSTLVSYDTFLDDLSSRLAEKISAINDMPEFVSQRKAYKLFGRANVMRWLRQGKITPHKRPGIIEYSTAELRHQKLRQQDYFK